MTTLLPPHRLDPLLDAPTIHARVAALAAEIDREAPEDLHVLVLLSGALIFAVDLVRELSRRGRDTRMSFVRASSYGDETSSSGRVSLGRLPKMAGDHMLLVDDILDTGRTIGRLKRAIDGLDAASVRTAVLLDKPERRVVDMRADHVGFSIPDTFVVGYGLDWAGRYRNLRDVHSVQFLDHARAGEGAR